VRQTWMASLIPWPRSLMRFRSSCSVSFGRLGERVGPLVRWIREQAEHLHYGDNLEILRRHVKDETVNLVYLDPSFRATRTTTFCSPSRATRGHSPAPLCVVHRRKLLNSRNRPRFINTIAARPSVYVTISGTKFPT